MSSLLSRLLPKAIWPSVELAVSSTLAPVTPALSRTAVAVTRGVLGGTVAGAVYVAEVVVTLVKLPHTAGPPVQPATLHVTPPFLKSKFTVAVKPWLPLVGRL